MQLIRSFWLVLSPNADGELVDILQYGTPAREICVLQRFALASLWLLELI